MDSLKSAAKACRVTLTDYTLGPDDSDIRVNCEDTYEHPTTGKQIPKGRAWFIREVLYPLGYCDQHGKPAAFGKLFPGLCKLTGYCADDDILESLYRSLCEGRTLSEAWSDLGSVVSRMIADDYEQQADEESMRANWGEAEFDEHGNMI